jgi:hypothetical protein
VRAAPDECEAVRVRGLHPRPRCRARTGRERSYQPQRRVWRTPTSRSSHQGPLLRGEHAPPARPLGARIRR